MPRKAKPKHLLWALMKINLYDTTRRAAVVLKVDHKTADKWIWAMLDAIVSIKDSVVSEFEKLTFAMSDFGSHNRVRSVWRTASKAGRREIRLSSQWIAQIAVLRSQVPFAVFIAPTSSKALPTDMNLVLQSGVVTLFG